MGHRADVRDAGRAGCRTAGGLAAAALLLAPGAAAAQSMPLEARPVGGVASQDRPDIPHPNPETDSNPLFDSADFWQGYLTELGYAGVTCTMDDPAGARAYTLQTQAPSADGWLLSVLVSNPGEDSGVFVDEPLAKLDSYPVVGQEYAMLYEEDYFMQLSSVYLCAQGAAQEPAPIVETDVPASSDDSWIWAGAGVVALAGGSALLLSARRRRLE